MIFFKISTSVSEKGTISISEVKQSFVLKKDAAFLPEIFVISTKVNDVTRQTSMTLKRTINNRILNLVIYVDNIKQSICSGFNKVPVASKISLFRSNKRERNPVIAKLLSLIISVSLHKIFTNNFKISIALLLLQSNVRLKKIKS